MDNYNETVRQNEQKNMSKLNADNLDLLATAEKFVINSGFNFTKKVALVLDMDKKTIDIRMEKA